MDVLTVCVPSVSSSVSRSPVRSVGPRVCPVPPPPPGRDTPAPPLRRVCPSVSATQGWISPDCAAGKHTACTGDAWDRDHDRPAPCTCRCHP